MSSFCLCIHIARIISMSECALFNVYFYAIVRLVNAADSTDLSQGRVEILHDGLWGTVCDEDWGNVDASVVCRMFGYTIGLALTHRSKVRVHTYHRI